ncbi:MAG: uroporphyrinogen decarboxylase family protein [Anaerolineae bacterium]
MTPKELVTAQIRHEETPHVPYAIGFEGDVLERLDGHYGGAWWRDLVDSAILHVPGADLSVDQSSGPLTTDTYGSLWRVDRRPFHLERPALAEPSLKGYRFPSVDECFAPGWEQATMAAIEEASGHFLVVGFGFGLFERTWTLRGFDGALMDAAADPGFYDDLVEAISEHQLAIIDRLLPLPVDAIMFSDDWGYQRGVLLGNERWRRFIKPRLAKQYERVHAAGKYTISHCCGCVSDIVPDLIEIGLDVLESVQPEAMDPYDLKRLYGGDITFWGGLGSQFTIPFGMPAGIRSEVGRLCREMGRGGGYILGPAKALQPETPTLNAAAVVESFLEQAGVSLRPR